MHVNLHDHTMILHYHCFPCTLPFHAHRVRQRRAKWSDLREKTAESSPAGFELLQVWRGRDNFLPLEFIF